MAKCGAALNLPPCWREVCLAPALAGSYPQKVTTSMAPLAARPPTHLARFPGRRNLLYLPPEMVVHALVD